MAHQEQKDNLMTDLTSIFIEATNIEMAWVVNEFYSVKDYLETDKFEISFWDGEENWAAIKKDGLPVGYLWKRYPLIIYQQEYETNLNQLFASFPFLKRIPVKDFQAKEYYINYKVAKNFIDYFTAINHFSINDLWFYTNAI